MKTETVRMACNAALFVLIAQQAAWSASAALEPSPNCRVDPHAAVDDGHAQQSRALLQGRHEQSSEMTLEGPLAMTEAVRDVDTPFSWVTLETTPNPKLYKDKVDGLCLKIIGIDDCAEQICECPGATSPCSKGVKKEYAITESQKGFIHNQKTSLSIYFKGHVYHDPEQQGANCTAYAVGAGPYAITNELEMDVGEAATFGLDATKHADNNFELFAGLFSKSRGLVEYKFLRGSTQVYEAFELPADQKDIYHMEFMVASYDRYNKGEIGVAPLTIKDAKVTKASPTPVPTPQPTPAPTVPSDAAYEICVFNTQHAKTVYFRVKHGETLIHQSPNIFKGGAKCVDIKNLVADLETVQVEIFVVGGLPKNKKTYSVTKHSQGKIWTQNCKKWSTNWECFAE